MDNTKNDQYYLDKICEELLYIIKITKRKTKKQIQKNQTLIKAISFSIVQISENAKLLSMDFKNKYDSIPWHLLIGLRNKIVHDYGGIDLSSLLDTIFNDLPEIYEILKERK